MLPLVDGFRVPERLSRVTRGICTYLWLTFNRIYENRVYVGE